MELRDAEMTFEKCVVKNEKQYKSSLSSFRPDIILSPYSLKGTNAIKLLGIAKTAKVEAPFILLAFDLSEDIAIDLLGEGIEDYVQQSTLKRLPVAIKKALQRYKTQLELQISEKKLRTSEQSLRSMVRNAPIAVAMFDLNMNYLVVSDVWLKHEKKTEKELIGNNHYSVVPEIPNTWKKVHQEVLQGASHGKDQEKMVRGDGRKEIIRWNMNPWYNSEGAIGGAVLFIEDITEKVAIRSALEKNERLLTIGEELGSSGSFEFDIQSETTSWSENMYKIKGFELTADISHESYIKHIHPDDLPSYLEAYAKILSFVAPTQFEYRLIRPVDGEIVHLRVHSTFVKNKEGKPIALMGSVQDITKIRTAEEEALKNAESLNIAQQIANIGSWEWKKGEGYLVVSDQVFSIYETKKKELTISDVRNFIHPEDKKRVAQESANDFNKNIKPIIAYRIITEKGNVKNVLTSARQVVNEKGEVIKLLGTVQDITNQNKDKEQIETLSLVASETVNGVLIHNPDKTVVWANKGFKTITGYEPEEIIGKEPWELVRAPETNQKLIDMTYEKINQGKSFTSDNQLLNKDGSVRWVSTSFAPILDAEGNVSKVVSIGTDITKQKELEELQRNMLTRMETRIAERTTELEAKNQELRKEIWENQRISDELYHHNLDLKDSIEYAKRIQESILPDEKQIQQSFPHGFVLFLPRDVVSGDFYWYYKRDNLSYFAAIDCTGHGVPGALMSMIANELMNQTVIQKKLTNPGEIITSLNKLMIRTLRQKEENNMRDGMDLSLIVVNHATDTLNFSGALSSIYVANGRKLGAYPGNRHSVGGHLEDVKKTFETTEIKIEKGSTIYLSTDGYIDQFGGPDGKKLMKKRFAEFLESIQSLPLDEQKSALQNKFNEWKGPLNQVDDVLVAGLSY